MSEQRSRDLVLVGGGHAHVLVLEAFADEPPPCRLTLVVDDPIAAYSGMVPGLVAGQYRSFELEIDVRPLAERAGATVIESAAVSIDPSSRRITTERGDTIPYTIAAFDIGSTVAGLDLPGVRDHAIPTRPIRAFVRRMHRIVEAAAAHDDQRPLDVVVVGAGAGGVELAFTIDARLRAEGVERVRTRLLERGPRILAGYPESLRRRIRRQASRRNVAIECERAVASVQEDAVLLEGGQRVPFDVLVWVTGAVSHGIFRRSQLPTDDRGFVSTRSTLQVVGHDDLFATGDCGTLVDHPRTPKAGVYAVRQGPIVTANLRAALAGEPLRRYTPQRDFLTLLNLGDGSAVGTKWGRAFQGRWVMLLKDWIDRRFVRRFQSEPAGVAPGFTSDDDERMADANRQTIEKLYAKSHRTFPEVAGITAAELRDRLEREPITIVDVRTPEEQAISMIPGALTAAQFEASHIDPSSTVVTYCTIGHRSGLYARQLAAQGWPNVLNLEGAILAWTHAGGPLERGGEQTHRVHVHGRKFDLVAEGYEGVW